MVFLPPNVHSQNDQGDLAHHGSFYMPVQRFVGAPGSLQGGWVTVYQEVFYAVIPHPQGNLADNGYNLTGLTTDFQKQTEIVSHELAEGVTDPDGNGWRDYTHNPQDGWWEIGDIVNQQVAWLDGYAVQREWSNYWRSGIAPLFDTGGALLFLPRPVRLRGAHHRGPIRLVGALALDADELATRRRQFLRLVRPRVSGGFETHRGRKRRRRRKIRRLRFRPRPKSFVR